MGPTVFDGDEDVLELRAVPVRLSAECMYDSQVREG